MLVRYFSDGVGIEDGQRLIHAALRRYVTWPYHRRFRRQVLPDPFADNLQLDRFDVRSQPLRHRAIRLLNVDPAQIVDELGGGGVGELNAAVASRLLDRLPRRVWSQKVEAVRCGQMSGDRHKVRVESGEVILADREERPAVVRPQRVPHLGEEGVLRVEIGRIGRQDLFELIEDQHHQLGLVAVRRGRLAIDLIEVATERRAGGIDGWEISSIVYLSPATRAHFAGIDSVWSRRQTPVMAAH